MKEYAFTKWLVPTLQADGTERDMVYNEQMGIFTVRGENQFQKGSIDTQHTVSLLVLKGEISIQTNDKRTVIPAPSYIEFIEPHQWSDLKTNRDFEGCLLITRREIFLQAAECIRSKVAAYAYRHVLEPFIPLEKQDLLPSSWKCGTLSSACINKKTSSSTLSAGKIPSLVFYT